MKPVKLSSLLPRPSKLAIATCLGIATLTVLPQKAGAQANLTFSGGSGTPLTMTIAAPITYTITTTSPVAPIFVFQGVGNPFLDILPSVTATMTFSINGGAAQTINGINSGVTGGSVATNDVWIFGSVPGVTTGDTVSLTAGAITTTTNIAAAAPANGAFDTFLVDLLNGNKISTLGSSSSAAPEPGTLALLALGTALGIVARRRK
jgi:hypothetical protein